MRAVVTPMPRRGQLTEPWTRLKLWFVMNTVKSDMKGIQFTADTLVVMLITPRLVTL